MHDSHRAALLARGFGDNGRVLIVTPNPAVDHTVRLSELRPGEVIRTGVGVSVAGGKGGNVARAAACLGVRATVLALLPETGGDHLRALYDAEGFELIAVPVAGRVRTCTALLEDAGRVTLLNEPGAELASGDWDRLLAALADRLDRAPAGEVIVCSGSLPPGAPEDGYARVVRAGRLRGCEVVVDASSRPLARAVAEHPDLVCPNLSEAEAVITAVTGPPAAPDGRSAGPVTGPATRPRAEPVHDGGDDVPERAAVAAAALHDLGASWAVVTAGAAGAAAAGPGTRLWMAAPAVTVRNPIGAGDSFLAGLATARIAGRDWPAAIRRGLAAGSASVEQRGAGVVDPARVDTLEASIPARG